MYPMKTIHLLLLVLVLTACGSHSRQSSQEQKPRQTTFVFPEIPEMLTEPAVPKAENGSRHQSTRAAKSDMQEVQVFFEELKKQLAEKDEQLSKRDAQIDRLLQIIENLSGN